MNVYNTLWFHEAYQNFWEFIMLYFVRCNIFRFQLPPEVARSLVWESQFMHSTHIYYKDTIQQTRSWCI